MICNCLKECIDNKSLQNETYTCPNKNRAVCIESSDQRSQIKCEENRKKYLLINSLRKYVTSYKMDGGIIVEDATVPNGTNKCDYLYIIYNNDDDRDAVMIELKGTDLSKALNQIKSTLMLFPNVFRTCTHVHGRVVVASAPPRLYARPEYVNLVSMLNRYHGTLKISEREFIEETTNLSS